MTSINIDVSQFRKLAENLDGMDSQLAEAGVETVNNVGATYYERSREMISQQVNLSSAYVNQRMSFDKASLALPTATIEARTRPTQLAQFGAAQVLATAKTGARAKGDRSRGIPAGSKAAGVSVQVHPGRQAILPHMFLIKLKNGNGFGVFSRTGKGKTAIRNRYGPSVDQIFRSIITETSDQLLNDLGTVLSLDLQTRIIDQLNK